MMRKLWFLFMAMFCAGICSAAMILTLNGKLTSFDEKSFSVEDSRFVYTVKKAALSADQKAYVHGLRTGMAIKLSVDQTAILRVVDRKQHSAP